MPATDTEDSLIPPPGPWRLDALQPGTLESLALTPSAPQPLAPTQVRVQMRAAGLNFRDVLIALGLYPGEASIGGEGAGVVVEVGSGVEDLAPGERVMGMISAAFGPLATSERDLLAPVPESWSFEQAAAMPIAFITAYYGLLDLAGLKAGEKVLIHAGAGGVGMAAIQIARQLGAEVFATASPAKWGALREAGIEEDHIASSRDLEFREKLLGAHRRGGSGRGPQRPGGRVRRRLARPPAKGRPLPRDGQDRHPRSRAAGGRAPRHLLPPLRCDRSRPRAHRGDARRDRRSLRAGRPAPLADNRLGHAQGAAGFPPPARGQERRQARAQPSAGDRPRAHRAPHRRHRRLGSLLARHLAEHHGARHLLLVSRSGPAAEGAEELGAELEELGAQAQIAACDISDPKATEALLASIPSEHPLGAVIHCAGAIDDGTVETLTDEQIDKVFAPKADAAWNLHELTAGKELSAFVLFSSVAGTLGGPGQANYAAANVFLDTLAQKRQAEGMPGISIAWGPWEGEGGMTAGLEEADRARMRRAGLGTLSDEQGLALFDAALGADRPLSLAVPIDSAGLRAQASSGALPPILSGLVRTPQRRSAASGSLAAKLAALPPAEHESFVLNLVRGEVAAVLGHNPGQGVEPERAFQEIGFDSLASVELRNRLNAATGLGLGATAVFDYPDPPAPRRAPAGRGDRERRRTASCRSRSGKRGAGRDRRHGLPLPRRGRLPRGPLAAGRLRPRRHHRVPHRPRLGPGAPL